MNENKGLEWKLNEKCDWFIIEYLRKEDTCPNKFLSFEIFHQMGLKTAADIPVPDQGSSTGIYQTSNTHPGVKKSHQETFLKIRLQEYALTR